MAGSLMVRSGKKIFVNDRLIEKKKENREIEFTFCAWRSENIRRRLLHLKSQHDVAGKLSRARPSKVKGPGC